MGVASYDNIKLEEIKKQLPTEKGIEQRIGSAEESSGSDPLANL